MRNDVQATVTVGGKRKARLNIVSGEIWEIVQDLSHGHSTAEVIENIGHRDACPANARLSAPDAWVNNDSVTVVHD